MHRVRIWTDGCCLKNPGGRGGWAYVVEYRGNVIRENAGGEPSTTNNRMELAAVIEALRSIDPGHRGRIEIVSDSEYVVKGATTWMSTWKANGWTRRVYGTKKRGAVKNVEAWKELDRFLSRFDVTFSWVKGHANHAHNERADELAGEAAKQQRPVPTPA